jgi:hypothetical protein
MYQDRQIPPKYTNLEVWMHTIDDASTKWNKEVHQAAASNTDETMEVRWKEMLLYADIAHP